MKINSIKYHNYRCFENVTVNFATNSRKNISLVKGVVGSGKTEMLFSFQWVLYGFDFKGMREKEETPYSLNSSLYHKLNTDKHARSVDCWVEVSFTHKDIEYYVKRSETFMRVKNKIESRVSVSLSRTESNGERTLPVTNKDEVEAILSRIIPKSILEGIIFDGERMKKLNSADDQAKETIKSVIALVTNESLFSLCLGEIKHSREDVTKEINRINRADGNTQAEDLENEIMQLTESIEDNEIKLHGINRNLDKIQNELDEISLSLSRLEDANKLEQKRKGLEKDLEKEKKSFDKKIDTFYKRLVDGYTLISDALVNDVKRSIEKIDIPQGLTVEAVKSILKRPKCICGCDMTEDVITRLNNMMSTLPPDNISSTILYMADQFGDEKRRTGELLKDNYKEMHESENEIKKIKQNLAEISTSLTENVSETVRELENRRNDLLQNLGRLNQDKEKSTHDIEFADKRLKEAKKDLEKISGNQDKLKYLSTQQSTLDLFKDAIRKIEEKNRVLSLASINAFLSDAFTLLSEDTGRQIYLCQYDKKDKYRLVTYVKEKYAEMHSAWHNDGLINTLRQDGLSDNEIKEKIILEVKEGKSTGQSKTNSLAFAKAILDYSNEDRSDDSLKVSHDYPFLIDSPFTELSGGNLDKIAENIHKFANQIILMADDKSYAGVEEYVAPYVCSSTYLYKDKGKGITYVK